MPDSLQCPEQPPVPQAALDIVRARIGSDGWDKVDQFDQAIADLPQFDFPLNHVFTPGLYTREIFMPAGALLTSRIHLTEHPFIVSAGACSVWSDEHGWQYLRAPHTGVTKPGTRRILYIHEDTIWTTIHPNPSNETDPATIVRSVTYDHLKLGHLAEIPADKKEIQ